jgi:ankyrin repeat protein
MAQEGDFLEAVKRGDTSMVANLLRSRRELARCAGEHDKTGLHWAAEFDRQAVAEMLLHAGADIEATTSWGVTPLDWAATPSGARVADLLLAHGASGFNLVVASALGKLDAVKSMMASGLDLSTQRRRGAPSSPNEDWPADSACLQGNVLSDAMYAAARNGHTHVVEYLLDQGVGVDAKGIFGGTALHWAAFNGHRDTVNHLLARAADSTIRNSRFDATPEVWAMENGHTDIAEALRGRAAHT